MIYFFAIIFYFLFFNSAYAYLVPGSTALVLQLIVGGIVGGLATLGIYWNRCKQFIKKFFKNKDPEKDNKKIDT